MPFISIDGPDGAGNTTISKYVAEYLAQKGFDVVHTAEPTKGPIGKIIRKRLRKEGNWLIDSLLFAADRAYHVNEVIMPALNSGKIVVCDRYMESSFAYQCAYGADEEFIENLNKFFPKPDLTIILIVPPEISLRRKKKLTDWVENIEFLNRVLENFKRRAAKNNYIVIDSSKPLNEVKNLVKAIIDDFISKIIRGGER